MKIQLQEIELLGTHTFLNMTLVQQLNNLNLNSIYNVESR